jgi:hypothetical protein
LFRSRSRVQPQTLDDVEKIRKGSLFINLLVPGYPQFEQGFKLTVDVLTTVFSLPCSIGALSRLRRRFHFADDPF